MSKQLKLTALLTVALAAALVFFSVVQDWHAGEPLTLPVSASGAVVEASPAVADGEMERRIRQFCGDCHPLPDPASFPAELWHEEISQGYQFYARSGRQDLQPPPFDAVLRYYLSGAPQAPSFPPPAESASPLNASFHVEKRSVPPQEALPEISNLHWISLGSDARRWLVACDMQYGPVVALDPNDAEVAPRVLARLRHPARLEPCSLSGDDSTELLVADLGSYVPSDHDRGRVVLLKRASEAMKFEEIVLASGLGRVADVRAIDFEQDGRQDFIVAEFGWQKTGGIWLYHNVSTVEEPLQFVPRRLDIRSGTIHLPVHDFDDDGFPDFAALTSQESESVELFLNATKRQPRAGLQKRAAFDRYRVWSAPDLTFGSSGLQLTDLNGNGRVDFLLTGGDAFDNNHVTPSHGVYWLENLGDLRFQYRRLASLPGAFSAKAFDVDQDGDLDVIAVSLLPRKVLPAILPATAPLASIICLEQTEPGVFVRHTLETGSPYYSAVEVGDFDGDGDADFAVGSGPMVAEERRDRHYLAVWWNQANDLQP